jgi:hypothetical protein
MINDDQYAGLCMTVKSLQKQVARLSGLRIDREALGKVAYEAYRASLGRTTDDPALPDWEGLDHESQLAFRDAAEACIRASRE